MLQTMHAGDDPQKSAGEELTGALKRVHDSLTNETREERLTLENALQSKYFQNLNNYRPDTVKELLVATAAYSSALKKQGSAKKMAETSLAVHAKRTDIQELERRMKEDPDSLRNQLLSAQEATEVAEAAMEIHNAETKKGNIDKAKFTVLHDDMQAKRLLVFKLTERLNESPNSLRDRWRGASKELKQLEAELRALSNDEAVQPHLIKIREISQRLQSGQ